ncbi:MAG: Nif3-like dinuclear metal center hexameric protein [Halanaerobiales bacterium]
MVKLCEIISAAERLAPEDLACEWDNVGLQVGNKTSEITRVLISLDINNEVIDEAIKKDCQLIMAHHPLIFKGVKIITEDSYQGQLLYKAIQNNLNIYIMHTNLDLAQNGLNDYLASILEVDVIDILDVTQEQDLFKLVVFIPVDHFEKVKSGILEAGAGHIGNYSHTSFSLKGQGSFKPLKGSNPYIGQEDQVSRVDEYRMETIVDKKDLKYVLEIMHNLHPYEEVAYDLYPLYNPVSEYGLGRLGKLKKEIKLMDYLELIKERLSIQQIKYIGQDNIPIKRVALCSGSGAELIPLSSAKGADVYITSDIKYHEAQLAEQHGIALIDAGHFHTENIVKKLLYEYFTKEFDDIDIIESDIITDPWKYLD